jgi:hypothetical protein
MKILLLAAAAAAVIGSPVYASQSISKRQALTVDCELVENHKTDTIGTLILPNHNGLHTVLGLRPLTINKDGDVRIVMSVELAGKVLVKGDYIAATNGVIDEDAYKVIDFDGDGDGSSEGYMTCYGNIRKHSPAAF